MTLARQLAATRARPVRLAGLAALRAEPVGDPGADPIGPVTTQEVLLVPGFTGSKEDFAPILDAVAETGRAATAIDLPGQFESPGPDNADAYTPHALGDVIRAVAAALGPADGRRVHLVGHSFGGLVARAAVMAGPDAFASLVLMGSGPAQIGGRRRAMLEMLGPALPVIGLAGVYEQISVLNARMPDYEPPSPELERFLRHRFLAGSPVMLQGMGLALRAEPDRTAELAATGIPMLVLHGERDDAWPPAEQADMARRLGARHVVVPHAMHSPAAENPDATVAALAAFWDAVSN